MVLTKDGQTISLDNENHVEAFLASGWAEVKSSAPVTTPIPEAEPEVAEPAPEAEPVEEVKTEAKAEKKPVKSKKQEK